MRYAYTCTTAYDWEIGQTRVELEAKPQAFECTKENSERLRAKLLDRPDLLAHIRDDDDDHDAGDAGYCEAMHVAVVPEDEIHALRDLFDAAQAVIGCAISSTPEEDREWLRQALEQCRKIVWA